MHTLPAMVIASTPVSVPDAGPSGLLAGLALLSLGIAVRLITNRKR
jgi:MYXO-CTERM domain-containing protein